MSHICDPALGEAIGVPFISGAVSECAENIYFFSVVFPVTLVLCGAWKVVQYS